MPKKLKKGKIVRREGINVFDADKYSRILARRSYKPGIHGPRLGRRRGSDYEQQLRTKQQLKLMYGMRERQFKTVVTKAMASKQNSAEQLIIQLERRLDNVVYRLQLANTRSQARQLVGHRHIAVNGKPVNIPSFLVSKGDTIEIRQTSKTKKYFSGAEGQEKSKKAKKDLPTWLSWNDSTMSGKVTADPDATVVAGLINVSKVIEFYSR